MYYAIGKELEDLERWDEAFDYFEKAGTAVAGVADYDVAEDIELIDAIIDSSSAAWLACWTAYEADASMATDPVCSQFFIAPQQVDAPAERHLRVLFGLDHGVGGDTGGTQLRFVDQRMFGGLSVSSGGAELPAEIAHIARDALDPEVLAAALSAVSAESRPLALGLPLLEIDTSEPTDHVAAIVAWLDRTSASSSDQAATDIEVWS